MGDTPAASPGPPPVAGDVPSAPIAADLAARSAVAERPAGAASLSLPLARPPRSTRELALHNYRLGFFNLVANWANMHRTKHLESAVRDGRAQIDGLNAKVQQQDGEIGELSEGLELVSGTLEAQKVQMDTALDKFGAQVAQQNDRIAQQQAVMERMMASKFQSDAVVDISIVALSGWLSSMPIISLPVYLLTMWLPRRNRWLATLLLRLAAFFKMARTMRNAAVGRGMHNGIGSPSAYIATAITYVTKKTKERMAVRRRGADADAAEMCDNQV